MSPFYRHRKLERLKPRPAEGNGIDLMLQLSNDYGLRGIALTGYGMAEDVAKTKQAGFWRTW